MPPGELNTIPTSELFQQTFADLKMTEKAMDIPVVNDTFAELEKFKNTLTENSQVQTLNHVVGVGMTMVEEGIQKIKENENSHFLLENEIIGKSVASMKDTVLPKVTGALGTLDHLACDGIDSLTSALPALNSSTPELYLTTKDTAKGYFLWATEYVASFTASQISLSMADTSLSMAEKVTGFMKPEDEGMASTTYARICALRRSLRYVKRAGARHNRPAHQPQTLEESGLLGRLASMFYVNPMLRTAGIQLVPAVKERKTGVSLDDSHSHLEDLYGDLGGYKSEEDPDYATESDEESSEDEAEEEVLRDEESSDEEAEIAREVNDAEMSRSEAEISREEDELEEEILRAHRAEESFEVDREEAEIARVEFDLTNEVVYETCGLDAKCCEDGTCEMGLEL